MKKRGQAAMEFLMTYGWAILAALVAIGVLAWFGVFSPGRFAPETCTLAPPLSCEEFQVQNDGVGGNDGVILRIRNGGGEAIVVQLAAEMNVSNTQTVCDGAVASGTYPWTINAGELITVTYDCGGTAAFAEGTRVRGDINIQYRPGSKTFNQTSTGSFSGTAA